MTQSFLAAVGALVAAAAVAAAAAIVSLVSGLRRRVATLATSIRPVPRRPPA
jgi:hypothetical protein